MKEHPILQTWRNVEFALTSFIFSFVLLRYDAARSTINDDDFFRLTLIGLDRPPSFTRSVKLLPFLLGPSMTDWQRGPHFGPSPTTFFPMLLLLDLHRHLLAGLTGLEEEGAVARLAEGAGGEVIGFSEFEGFGHGGSSSARGWTGRRPSS